MRGFLLIGFALIIDFLQGMLMLAFAALQFITPAGGGVGGALAGCYANATAWYDVTGCITGAAIGGAAGATLSAFAVPLGMAVDVGLSVTLGGALILALAWVGAFYPGTVITAFIGESIPLLDLFPGWTLMTWRCLSNKKAEEKAAKIKQGAPVTVQSVQAPPQAFDGIRAANDNQSYAQQAA